MRRNLVLSASVAAAVLAAVTGCGAQSDDPRNQRQGSASSPASTAGPSISPVPTPTQTAASKEITINKQKLPLEVYSLKRDGTFVTLQFGL